MYEVYKMLTLHKNISKKSGKMSFNVKDTKLFKNIKLFLLTSQRGLRKHV